MMLIISKNSTLNKFKFKNVLNLSETNISKTEMKPISKIQGRRK